jgi:hypothetical protein
MKIIIVTPKHYVHVSISECEIEALKVVARELINYCIVDLTDDLQKLLDTPAKDFTADNIHELLHIFKR